MTAVPPVRGLVDEPEVATTTASARSWSPDSSETACGPTVATPVPLRMSTSVRELRRDRPHPAGRQGRRPVGERAQDEVEKAARGREPLLEEDPAQERREEGLDRRARDAGAPEGLGGRGLVAAAAEELEHSGAVAHADEPAGERAQAAHRGVARVGEAAEAAVRADDRAALEQPEVEPVEVEHRPGLAVGRGQHLEAVVEQEPVDGVGPDAAADRVRALEDERLPAGGDQRAGAGEAGHPGADDDDVVFRVHDREGTATTLSRRARSRGPSRCRAART